MTTGRDRPRWLHAIPNTPEWQQERNAQIRLLRDEGVTLSEIGIRFGVTTQRVSQILKSEHRIAQRKREQYQREGVSGLGGWPVMRSECLRLNAWFELHGGAEAFAMFDESRISPERP